MSFIRSLKTLGIQYCWPRASENMSDGEHTRACVKQNFLNAPGGILRLRMESLSRLEKDEI